MNLTKSRTRRYSTHTRLTRIYHRNNHMKSSLSCMSSAYVTKENTEMKLQCCLRATVMSATPRLPL